MVFIILIIDYQIDNILIDKGSFVNILFKSIFNKMCLFASQLNPTIESLYGSSGEHQDIELIVTLPVT